MQNNASGIKILFRLGNLFQATYFLVNFLAQRDYDTFVALKNKLVFSIIIVLKKDGPSYIGFL